MENALIVAASQKSAAGFGEILSTASIKQIVTLQSCGEARRLLLEQSFDLVVISGPLSDETGESLARHIASRGLSQVILAVKAEHFDAISAVCEGDGVLTIAKPMNRAVFWSALSLAKAAHNRMSRIQSENYKLKQKIEDIRVIDRAKCILISYMGMSEQDAHRYIEKQAMDMRVSKRTVAEGLLKTYES